jgi:Ser/Thr protein kinase RdoA (MazF antagonist)
LKRLGRFLARLHNVGQAMPPVSRVRLDPTTYGREPLKQLEDLKILPPGLGPTYATIVKQICDQIDPYFEKLDCVLLHGDCHAGNILWNGDAPYFIDFDDMLYAPPVQDFWMLIGGSDEFAMKNRDLLLDAYEEIRSFDYSSLKLTEPLRGLRLIYFNTWIARRWEDGAFKMAFPHFGTEKYWQEQLENLSLQAERIRAALTD